MMPTICRDCDNVEAVSRKDAPYRWLCTKFPRVGEYGFVNPEYWDAKEPYNKCMNINLGSCPLFTPKRDAK